MLAMRTQLNAMPVKLTIAVARKIGQPNYGSRGATVGLEIEEVSFAEQPQQLPREWTNLSGWPASRSTRNSAPVGPSLMAPKTARTAACSGTQRPLKARLERATSRRVLARAFRECRPSAG
jgi:hypothetical protein